MSNDSSSGLSAKFRSFRDLHALCEEFDFESEAFLRSTFTYVDEDDYAWYGEMAGIRKYDLTIDLVRQNIRKIPDEKIYPLTDQYVTLLPLTAMQKDVFIKRPKLTSLGDEEETKLLPRILSDEVKVLESLKQHPHPNLVQYLGCVVKRGRIIGIALERHNTMLQTRFEDDAPDLDVVACMTAINAGIAHLHSLGYAHNDLNPMNIALDGKDQPIILDFGSCRRFGEQLLTAGTHGWIDEEYITSAARHDVSALDKLKAWMEKEMSRKATAKKGKV